MAGADGRTLALFLADARHEGRKTILAERRKPLQAAVDSLTADESRSLPR
ncbi:hypothetical protein H6F93_17045 [Leptolyngbya sp. FACHB-671]|nr:hypothetical protein [Leptolyngbya sp. FACHB-671]MBD2069201.1 hypothetical protein [Leptolyngbya sp. FACHB-671]